MKLMNKEVMSVTGISEVETNKYHYIEQSRKQGKTSAITALNDYFKNSFFQTWKPEMYNDRRYAQREMHELKRCGCNQCREKYYHFERDYYRYRDYYTPIVVMPTMIGTDQAKETKMEKIEEPKNYAVKLLVDQLKAQQTSLTSKKTAIEQDKAEIKRHQGNLKTKNTEKLAIENKIKELSVALKKLGHKE